MDRHTTGKLMSGLLALGQLAAGVYLVAHGGSAETYALGAVLLAGVGGTALLPRLREPRPTERRQLAEPERKRGPAKVTLNGREREVHEYTLSYAEIAEMVGTTEPTVTYTRGAGGASGSVAEWDFVTIEDGMIINAVRT